MESDGSKKTRPPPAQGKPYVANNKRGLIFHAQGGNYALCVADISIIIIVS